MRRPKEKHVCTCDIFKKTLFPLPFGKGKFCFTHCLLSWSKGKSWVCKNDKNILTFTWLSSHWLLFVLTSYTQDKMIIFANFLVELGNVILIFFPDDRSLKANQDWTVSTRIRNPPHLRERSILDPYTM